MGRVKRKEKRTPGKARANEERKNLNKISENLKKISRRENLKRCTKSSAKLLS